MLSIEKQQLLTTMKEVCNEYLEYSVNLENFMCSLEVYFDICNSRPCENDAERKLALLNTIKEHLDENILIDSPILLETFDFLSKYDRITIRNDQPLLYLLDTFFENLAYH